MSTTYTVLHGATGETLATGLSCVEAVNLATDSSLTDEFEARALMDRIARNDGEHRYHTVLPVSGPLTVEDVREIAAASGLSHAEFCVEQEATQIGREAAEPLFAELARLQQA